MNITSKTLMTMVAAMAITLTGWAKTLPGVAPMAPDQLAQWRAEETLVNAPKAAAKSDLAFYTGKPYDADLNAYVFPFRNYNPDLCRWTVADPSGFPDGANNYCYAPTPNLGCDPWGLEETKLVNWSFVATGCYQSGVAYSIGSITPDVNAIVLAFPTWGTGTTLDGLNVSPGSGSSSFSLEKGKCAFFSIKWTAGAGAPVVTKSNTQVSALALPQAPNPLVVDPLVLLLLE